MNMVRSGVLLPARIFVQQVSYNWTSLRNRISHVQTPVGYWQRYITFLKYGTLKKHLNFAHALFNWWRGATTISNMPAFLKVEISRECKLACKLCLVEKPSWFYSFENYSKLIDRLKEHVYLVSLYDIGEPLESDDLIRCIRYAKQRRIGSVISTSLSVLKNDAYWEELVLSGLDKMIVAIDGVTPAVYNQYRTNGDLTLVMHNLQRILHYKKKHRSSLYVEWQMIDFKWNKEEQPLAEQKAKEMGCSNFRLINEAVKARLRYKKENTIRTKNCLLPYIIFIVTADNKVRPCYKIYNEKVDIGDLSRNSFDEIWNGDEVKRIRDKNLIGCRPGCRTCQE